jgi:signal transduction histidine kinase
VAAAIKFKPRNRFAGLGALFARFGPFDAWLVAVPEQGELRVTAASTALAPLPPLTDASAIADSIRRQTAIVRATAGSHAAFQEDRLFARFAAYLCLPMGDGGVALAARDPIADATVAQVEVLAARLTPVMRLWMAEAETEQLRRLVRNLGLRMFGAIDTERARIARDLHDHQAQLLAAARIAIEAGPDEARGIFKQVEDALRLRVRELRPATLGRSTLADALRYELRRLSEAGIKGRILHAERMNRLTRPVQQLCYQVAREALANVMRHSGASRVEVAIEKRQSRVRLIILDNGSGVAAPSRQWRDARRDGAERARRAARVDGWQLSDRVAARRHQVDRRDSGAGVNGPEEKIRVMLADDHRICCWKKAGAKSSPRWGPERRRSSPPNGISRALP